MFYVQLEKLCKERGEKVTPLVKKLDISPGGIGRWQSGTVPNGDTLIKFARYFDVSTDYLLGLTENYNNLNKMEGNNLKKDAYDKQKIFMDCVWESIKDEENGRLSDEDIIAGLQSTYIKRKLSNDEILSFKQGRVLFTLDELEMFARIVEDTTDLKNDDFEAEHKYQELREALNKLKSDENYISGDITASAVVNGTNQGVNALNYNGSEIRLSDKATTLLRIFESLDSKNQNQLLRYALELEDMKDVPDTKNQKVKPSTGGRRFDEFIPSTGGRSLDEFREKYINGGEV